MLQPGDTLGEGRYEIEGELGKGGMATVYRVRDTRLRVHRALKILDPELSARPGLRQRFEVEAHAMAKLSHPNIVRVFDVVDDGTHFYIVMELITGSSILEAIDDGPMHIEPALRAIGGVLSALEAAHAAKIIHRDIKPHNLLLSEEEEVRVSDFGIAQCADFAGRSVTRTGAVMGTWAFMAPEQRADAKGVDPGADIYSAGATLYAMVTGLTPPDLFAAEIDPAMYEDVPTPVRDIIRKATRYWSWERYGSAKEMREDIEIVLERVVAGTGFQGLDLRLKDAVDAPPTPPPNLTPETVAVANEAKEPPPAPKAKAPRARPRPIAPVPPRRTYGWVVVLACVLVGVGAWFLTEPMRSKPANKAPAPTAPLAVEKVALPPPPPPAATVTSGAPTLNHTPVQSASVHEQLVLRAEVTGSSAYDQLTVHFRSVGAAVYRTAKMNRARAGYRGYLPVDRTMKNGLEYYIEAKSYASANPPLKWGSAQRPHKVRLTQ